MHAGTGDSVIYVPGIGYVTPVNSPGTSTSPVAANKGMAHLPHVRFTHCPGIQPHDGRSHHPVWWRGQRQDWHQEDSRHRGCRHQRGRCPGGRCLRVGRRQRRHQLRHRPLQRQPGQHCYRCQLGAQHFPGQRLHSLRIQGFRPPRLQAPAPPTPLELPEPRQVGPLPVEFMLSCSGPLIDRQELQAVCLENDMVFIS